MVKSMKVDWWVERWADLHPDKPAILFEGEEISYRDLNRRVVRAVSWLKHRGLKKGDRVAALLHNCPEFIEIYLACSRLGAIFVPINFRLAPPELDYILGNSRPGVLVYGTDHVDALIALDLARHHPRIFPARVGPGYGLSGSGDYRRETASLAGSSPCPVASEDVADIEDPQVLMYTSGTSGLQKGAVLPYRKTFFNCLNTDIFLDLSADDVVLIVMPLFHSGALFIQATPSLFRGATLVIHSRLDPLGTFQAIERHRVTRFLGVPTIYRELMRVSADERADLSSLKVCLIGGEQVTPELIADCRRNGFRVRQIFGQTETSILLWASEEESEKRPGTVGRPVFHAEVGIVNPNGLPVEPGEVGELVVRGPVLMKEYWEDPAETERTIREGRLHTGDLARQDEDGYFYLVDRAKDMYISGGENVYPAEIERILQEHPGIEDSAVIGAPDEKWGEVGHAHVICRDGIALTEEEVLDLCRGRLARFKWPARVTFCSDFPRTPLGKVRKFLLRKEIRED